MTSARAPVLPPRLVRDIRLRAVAFWVGVRVVAGLLGWLSAASVYGLEISFGVAALAALLVLLDVRITREWLMVANLGVSKATILTLALTPPALLETALQVVRVSLGRW
jgi:hypothetical protein